MEEPDSRRMAGLLAPARIAAAIISAAGYAFFQKEMSFPVKLWLSVHAGSLFSVFR